MRYGPPKFRDSGTPGMLPPGTPNVQRGISPLGQLRMEQVRSASASTQRVDVENGLARPIWTTELEVTPEEASGPIWRLRQKRVVFQRKSVSWKAP